MSEERDIGSIGNYYGCLSVKVDDGKFYWGIENWDGTWWEEILKSLYDELIKFEESADQEQYFRKEKSQRQTGLILWPPISIPLIYLCRITIFAQYLKII